MELIFFFNKSVGFYKAILNIKNLPIQHVKHNCLIHYLQFYHQPKISVLSMFYVLDERKGGNYRVLKSNRDGFVVQKFVYTLPQPTCDAFERLDSSLYFIRFQNVLLNFINILFCQMYTIKCFLILKLCIRTHFRLKPGGMLSNHPNIQNIFKHKGGQYL